MRQIKEIESLEELKESCLNSNNDYFMALGGNFISRKFIEYNKDSDSWFILHCIDDYQVYYKSTNEFIEKEGDRIIESIREKRFFVESYTS